MPPALIECVVNVSEGRNLDKIAAIQSLWAGRPGLHLLHTDVGYDANRTVFTLAGRPEAVVEAAFDLFGWAKYHLDMRSHQGSHPRMGAVDVCPLVPIQGIGLKETAELARQLGKRIGEQFDIPVYGYEAAATAPYRQNLADVRRGGYEGLPKKLKDPRWRPDFGPSRFDPVFGAAIVGARPYLIAYNINLEPKAPLKIAKDIAARLRESGRNGVPGLFKGLKAIGWSQPEYGRHQISTNVVNPDSVNLGGLYEAARAMARQAGFELSGSELIGLIPERHLVAAGRHYSPEADTDTAIQTAIDRLGLAALAPFDPETRILERNLKHGTMAAGFGGTTSSEQQEQYNQQEV